MTCQTNLWPNIVRSEGKRNFKGQFGVYAFCGHSLKGIFKVLQMRDILLDDNIKKCRLTKSRTCNTFINNEEWTPADIRFCEHIPHSKRNDLLKKYNDTKRIKYEKVH